MPNELKPCPFYGGKAIFYSYDPFDGYQGNCTMYAVECTSCVATAKVSQKKSQNQNGTGGLTMAEFIEREAVNNICLKHYNESFDDIPAHEALYAVTDDINNIPAADVVEVVHGKWINAGTGITKRIVCSHCHSHKGSYLKPPFCSQCGAKMDGERRKEDG